MPFVDRMLEQRIANLSFGDDEAFRLTIKDDPPLQKAMDLLGRGERSQADLFALATPHNSGSK
jgi:hypothetical protein